MPRKSPEQKAQEIGELARNFADSHPQQFPKQPPPGQWFEQGENFVHVNRAIGTYEVTRVRAEIVTDNNVDGIEVTMHPNGSVESVQTFQGINVPVRRRWNNQRPSIERARRVFGTLSKEMNPQQ